MSLQHFSPKIRKTSEFKSFTKRLKCRFCKSENVIKRGFRKTLNRGKIQTYFCNDCKKRFTPNIDGFFRMRNNSQKITQSLHMYFSGMSLRKSQEHLGIFYNHNASHMTILRWIRKYMAQIGKFTDNIKLKTSNELMFDEMEYKTKGKQSWFIDVLDPQTRFIINSGYFYHRGLKEMKEVIGNASKRNTNKITDVYTDGMKLYPRLLRKYYNMHKQKKDSLKHHITTSSDKSFNWKIERLHNSIRERTKIIRQFKSINSAKAIMKGWEIYYNFCRKHMAIKCYPYELATDLELGKNKLLDLIRLSINN